MTNSIEEARRRHWHDLLNKLTSVTLQHDNYREGRIIPPLGIFNLESNSRDAILYRALLSHLKMEFPEFGKISDWRDLVTFNINLDLLGKMRLVKLRRTFVGSCEICQAWETSGNADAPVDKSNTARKDDSVNGGISTRIVIDSLLKIKRHQRLKDSSMKTYEKHLAFFEKAYPLLPENQDVVLDYLERFDGKSGRTRLNRQSELVMLYQHAHQKFGFPNPMIALPRPEVRHSPVLTLSLIEVSLLDTTPATLRERAALDMLLGHGWRQIEIRRITAGDVSKLRDGLIWVHGKERDEWAPILPETQNRLEALASGLAPDQGIFRGQRGELGENGMSLLIERLYSKAGLHDMKGHDLRRTFSTLVREASHDEFLAMRLLRDKIPGQNVRYLAVTPAQLRESLKLYSPLRLITTVSPSRETGDTLVETGERACLRKSGNIACNLRSLSSYHWDTTKLQSIF